MLRINQVAGLRCDRPLSAALSLRKSIPGKRHPSGLTIQLCPTAKWKVVLSIQHAPREMIARRTSRGGLDDYALQRRDGATAACKRAGVLGRLDCLDRRSATDLL